MRKVLLAAATIAGLLGVSAALAETTIIKRDVPSEVVIEKPASETTTTTTEDHGDGCTTSSKTKENDLGERKTVTKEECD